MEYDSWTHQRKKLRLLFLREKLDAPIFNKGLVILENE